MFIDEIYIDNLLKCKPTKEDIQLIIKKSREGKTLDHQEVAKLISCDDKESLKLIFDEASRIKRKLYGNRVVLFAPLYVSDFCKNNCTYCGYKYDNQFDRKKLSFSEIKAEVSELEKLGHKRLALEVGEDEVNFSFEEILSSIDAIYEGSDIRRINVNIAPVSVEKFARLKEKNIGTYILFQETYDQSAFQKYHPRSLKGNYERQLYAHHNAMKGGVDDVGGGVLFGLADYKKEVISLVLHNEELEKEFGVGFHTVSVPRLKKAPGMELDMFNNLVTDDEFRKIVAVLRITIPFTGIILSTRETIEMRQELIDMGITQISAGSQTGVGGYKESANKEKNSLQFETNDERSPLEVIKDLIKRGYLPSYCTACYRSGRTGLEFMDIVKANKIHLLCHPNSLITFAEYIEDYGDEELKSLGYTRIDSELAKIENDKYRATVAEKISKIRQGERDLYV